ncbi:hypothetical protein VP01_782g2, partial [Puccinia sorghi]
MGNKDGGSPGIPSNNTTSLNQVHNPADIWKSIPSPDETHSLDSISEDIEPPKGRLGTNLNWLSASRQSGRNNYNLLQQRPHNRFAMLLQQAITTPNVETVVSCMIEIHQTPKGRNVGYRKMKQLLQTKFGIS